MSNEVQCKMRELTNKKDALEKELKSCTSERKLRILVEMQLIDYAIGVLKEVYVAEIRKKTLNK